MSWGLWLCLPRCPTPTSVMSTALPACLTLWLTGFEDFFFSAVHHLPHPNTHTHTHTHTHTLSHTHTFNQILTLLVKIK